MTEFLLLKELHRPPPRPQGQTSAQAHYVTTNTAAAQRLRAVGLHSLIRNLGCQWQVVPARTIAALAATFDVALPQRHSSLDLGDG